MEGPSEDAIAGKRESPCSIMRIFNSNVSNCIPYSENQNTIVDLSAVIYILLHFIISPIL